MFAKWDAENSTIVGAPRTTTKEGYYPIVVVGKKTSAAQSMTCTLQDGHIIAEWIGSPNPDDAPAGRDALIAATKYILQLPLAASDGKVFQFDTDSEAVMVKVIKYLKATPQATTDWRLLDNTAVTVDGDDLEGYYNELALAQAARLVIVDPQYLSHKNNEVTVAELAAWVKTYEDNPDINSIA